MLEIRNITAGYYSDSIISNISFSMKEGTITSLIGPNGSGKSTLLKTVTGLLPHHTGSLYINGEDISLLSKAYRSRKIAYLSQVRNIPDISVFRLVLHGRFPYLSYPRKYRKKDISIAENAMERMGISDLREENLQTLSGGTRQKVYLAMALCQQADFIMLDEPCTYLDIYEQQKLNKILRGIADEGKTVLTVSHDIIGSLRNSDRIAVMNQGSLLCSSTPSEILKSGVLRDVFHIEIGTAYIDGSTEYYYKSGEVQG